jgi:hypothetical protein
MASVFRMRAALDVAKAPTVKLRPFGQALCNQDATNVSTAAPMSVMTVASDHTLTAMPTLSVSRLNAAA